MRVLVGDTLLPTPFLFVPNVDTAGERGLLSIAFPPDYASSGLFYVFSVAAGPDALGGAAGDLRVIEYRRSASDPNLAEPSSARLVLAQSHPGASNHNGGQLAFGPDGHLYVTMGDGAAPANAQDSSNDLGKVLRIDPRLQPGGAPFGVPPSNPFAGSPPPARPEIYALGLRNPFRASFAPNGDLIVPDVGQGAWEEVNVGRATGTPAATTLAGANLGWPDCEGACVPANPAFVDPLFQYAHPPGPAEATGCAVIGGYVVRDPRLTDLVGRYLYGDLCRSDLRTLDLSAPGADPRPAGLSVPSGGPIGFGEHARGCVYVIGPDNAYRIAPSADAGAACPEPPPGAEPPAGPAADSAVALDSRRPRLSLRAHRRQPLRRAVALSAACDEACSLRASASTLTGVARARNRSLASASPRRAAPGRPPVTRRAAGPGERVRLAVRLRRELYRRAQRALRDGRRPLLRVHVEATDASGNASRSSIRIRLLLPARR